MKNKVKYASFLLGGVLLGTLTVAGANQAIQAIQNTGIKVSLNGQVQSFKDEKTGEAQYPITYHDRTYLPLRNVAQLAGLDVDYDEKTNTAILSSGKPIESKRMNNYILPNSNKEVISQYEHLSYDQLMFAKNEIFARYGYDFSSKKIRSYFDMQEWYKPVKGKIVKTEELSSIEQQNVKILDEELNRRLTWVNEGNKIQEISMPDYNESFNAEKILNGNGIDVQKLSVGSYSYRVNGLKIGSETYQAYIHFEINEIYDNGYRQPSNSEFYIIKDSKVILDFSADGYYGATTLDDIGDIYISKDYIVNVKNAMDDYCDMLVCDKDGTYLYLDGGLAVDVTTRNDGKLFGYKYDEFAGRMEGSIGDYNYFKSIYEFYKTNDGKLLKRRVAIDYSSVHFTAQT